MGCRRLACSQRKVEPDEDDPNEAEIPLWVVDDNTLMLWQSGVDEPKIPKAVRFTSAAKDQIKAMREWAADEMARRSATPAPKSLPPPQQHVRPPSQAPVPPLGPTAFEASEATKELAARLAAGPRVAAGVSPVNVMAPL